MGDKLVIGEVGKIDLVELLNLEGLRDYEKDSIKNIDQYYLFLSCKYTEVYRSGESQIAAYRDEGEEIWLIQDRKNSLKKDVLSYIEDHHPLIFKEGEKPDDFVLEYAGSIEHQVTSDITFIVNNLNYSYRIEQSKDPRTTKKRQYNGTLVTPADTHPKQYNFFNLGKIERFLINIYENVGADKTEIISDFSYRFGWHQILHKTDSPESKLISFAGRYREKTDRAVSNTLSVNIGLDSSSFEKFIADHNHNKLNTLKLVMHGPIPGFYDSFPYYGHSYRLNVLTKDYQIHELDDKTNKTSAPPTLGDFSNFTFKYEQEEEPESKPLEYSKLPIESYFLSTPSRFEHETWRPWYNKAYNLNNQERYKAASENLKIIKGKYSQIGIEEYKNDQQIGDNYSLDDSEFDFSSVGEIAVTRTSRVTSQYFNNGVFFETLGMKNFEKGKNKNTITSEDCIECDIVPSWDLTRKWNLSMFCNQYIIENFKLRIFPGRTISSGCKLDYVRKNDDVHAALSFWCVVSRQDYESIFHKIKLSNPTIRLYTKRISGLYRGYDNECKVLDKYTYDDVVQQIEEPPYLSYLGAVGNFNLRVTNSF